MSDADKKIVYFVQPEENGNFIAIGNALELNEFLFANLEDDAEYICKAKRMTQEEFDALPEGEP